MNNSKLETTLKRILLVLLLIFVAGLVFTFYQYVNHPVPLWRTHKVTLAIFFGILTVLTLFHLRRPVGHQLGFLVVLTSALGSLMLLEVAIPQILPDKEARATKTRKMEAVKRGKPWDELSYREKIVELNNADQNVKALDKVERINHHLTVEGKKIFFYGAAPFIQGIFCNENGTYINYSHDRYGFLNDDTQWDKNTDILLVGDSFTYGNCVEKNQNIAAQINQKGLNAISLGYPAYGPLQELGILKEFVQHKKTKHIFWIYYEENDFFDLDLELLDSILPRYIEDEFHQNYFKNYSKIGTEAERLISEHTTKVVQKNTKLQTSKLRRLKKVLLESITLHKTRSLILAALKLPKRESNYDVFRKILIQAKKTADRHGAVLHFVHLPGFLRYRVPDFDSYNYSFHASFRNLEEEKRQIKTIANNLKINYIDIDKEFRKLDNPTDAFVYGIRSHYNPKGYGIVATAISNAVKQSQQPLGSL